MFGRASFAGAVAAARSSGTNTRVDRNLVFDAPACVWRGAGEGRVCFIWFFMFYRGDR